MRCIKRKSAIINIGKSKELDMVIAAFNREKQHWLGKLQTIDNMQYINQFRNFRDKQLACGYQSVYKLQARQWKMALNEACETMHKYWLSHLDIVRNHINKNTTLTATQKHYANYLIHNN